MTFHHTWWSHIMMNVYGDTSLLRDRINFHLPMIIQHSCMYFKFGASFHLDRSDLKHPVIATRVITKCSLITTKPWAIASTTATNTMLWIVHSNHCTFWQALLNMYNAFGNEQKSVLNIPLIIQFLSVYISTHIHEHTCLITQMFMHCSTYNSLPWDLSRMFHWHIFTNYLSLGESTSSLPLVWGATALKALSVSMQAHCHKHDGDTVQLWDYILSKHIQSLQKLRSYSMYTSQSIITISYKSTLPWKYTYSKRPRLKNEEKPFILSFILSCQCL